MLSSSSRGDGRDTPINSLTNLGSTRFCFDVKHVTGNPRDENATLKMLYGLCTEGNCTDDQCKAEDEKMASAKAKADQYCADLNVQFPQSEK